MGGLSYFLTGINLRLGLISNPRYFELYNLILTFWAFPDNHVRIVTLGVNTHGIIE